MNFYVAPSAEYDLHQIWDRIAEDDLGRADNFCEKLNTAMAMLGDHPLLGHTRDEFSGRNVRVWSVGNYLIIYKPSESPIEIVRIISGFRDLRRLEIGD